MIPENSEMRFEVTTFCQYKCIICMNGELCRPKETMSLNLFKFLLDKILAETSQYKSLTFAGLGESLLDVSLEEKVKYARAKGLDPLLITNGDKLTPEKFIELQAAGLHSVRVSFHGQNAEDYAKMHGVDGSQFAKVKGYLDAIFPLRKTTKVLLTHVAVPGVNVANAWAWRALWEGKADLVEVWLVHNWGDLFKHRRIQGSQERTCGRVFDGPLQVQVDGTVILCCFDYDGKLTVGDLKTQNLDEIFSSPEYRRIATRHKTGMFAGAGLLCENCDQRNCNKEEALIYSSAYKDVKDRVNRTSTAYNSLQKGNQK